MRLKIEVLTKSIIAGILIAIAGSVYLSLYGSAKIVGAFLFSFALLVVVFQGLNLYTGKIGYVIDHKPSYLLDIFLMILGNALGIILIAHILRLGNLTTIIDKAKDCVDVKLGLTIWEVLGRSIMCGMLMYIAVEGSRRIDNLFFKPFLVILCVMIFILSNYEHSIANIFYITMANKWSLRAIGYVAIMLLGNGLGAILLNGLEKLAKLKK